MSSSNSSTTIRYLATFTPLCLHELPCDIQTSHSEENPHLFFCYPVREYDDCDFSQWLDSPIHSNFCRNNCTRRLKLLQDRYDAEVHARAGAKNLLNEKLRLKIKECESLKAKLGEVVKESEELKKWSWDVIKKIVVAVFFVVVAEGT
ncbi:hypothetical protein OROHE_019752 [Orobanche hederae]